MISSIQQHRNRNLDLLRILSMFMIVLLHSQTFGIFHYGLPSGIQLFTVYLFRNLAIVASNCYVLISGYFLIKKGFKRKKIAYFAFEVSFYSAFIYLMIVLFTPLTFSIQDFFHWIFVLFWGNYWFATLYLVLYLLSPFLNLFLNQLTQKQFQQVLIGSIAIFSFWATFSHLPILGMNEGYSISNFLLLYTLGAYFQLYQLPFKWKSGWYLFHYFNIAVGLTVYFFLIDYKDWMIDYHSPFVLLASVLLFLFFKETHFKKTWGNKIVPFIFGIYLIHEHPLIRTLLWEEWIPIHQIIQQPLMNFILLGLSTLIFIVCLLLSLPLHKLSKRIFEILLTKLN